MGRILNNDLCASVHRQLLKSCRPEIEVPLVTSICSKTKKKVWLGASQGLGRIQPSSLPIKESVGSRNVGAFCLHCIQSLHQLNRVPQNQPALEMKLMKFGSADSLKPKPATAQSPSWPGLLPRLAFNFAEASWCILQGSDERSTAEHQNGKDAFVHFCGHRLVPFATTSATNGQLPIVGINARTLWRLLAVKAISNMNNEWASSCLERIRSLLRNAWPILETVCVCVCANFGETYNKFAST